MYSCIALYPNSRGLFSALVLATAHLLVLMQQRASLSTSNVGNHLARFRSLKWTAHLPELLAVLVIRGYFSSTVQEHRKARASSVPTMLTCLWQHCGWSHLQQD